MREVIERLKTYIPLKLELENEAERRKRLQAQETYHPAKMSNLINGRVDYEDKPPAKVVAMREELAEIERWIDSVDDPLEREVLRLRYIDGDEYDRTKLKKWDDVARNLYGNDGPGPKRAAQRLHDGAVLHLREKEESHP